MMPLNNASAAFEQRYASHLKHLKLQGLQTKTVDAYARAIRTMGEHFDWQIDTLTSPIERFRSRLRAIYPYSSGVSGR